MMKMRKRMMVVHFMHVNRWLRRKMMDDMLIVGVVIT
jgi:hypothetical protein